VQEHSLLTVDETGCVGMHAVAQLVVRNWLVPKAQQSVLLAALVDVLASKLCRFDHYKPSTFFIGPRRWYARLGGAVAARAREWGILLVPQPGSAGGNGGVDAGQGGGGAELNNIGVMCSQAGFFFERVSVQPCEALRMHEAALDSAITLYGKDHPIVAACYA